MARLTIEPPPEIGREARELREQAIALGAGYGEGTGTDFEEWVGCWATGR